MKFRKKGIGLHVHFEKRWKRGVISERKIRKQRRVYNSKFYVKIEDSEAIARVLTFLWYQIKM